jgi:two-component system, NtrC family, sensor histidine kinase HydH
VLTRRLSLKLLAPTVLVSLVLVAACTVGNLYLNSLHVNASDVLSENQNSTRAAILLKNTAKELDNILKDHPEGGQRARLWSLKGDIQKRLRDAQYWANLPRERELVGLIDQGLAEFEQALSQRQPPAKLSKILNDKVLGPSDQLFQFNTGQIEESDRDNRAIVATLRWGLLAVGLGGPLIGLLLGYAVSRGLSRSIYQLSVGIRDAAGRLNRELGSVTLEEKGDLPDLHRQMQGVVGEIERVVEQLQQREREVLRAEQLAAVGQVAAGVAHELRNPLTSVKMLVQTGLEGDRPSGLPAEDLTIIEQEIRRMEHCIQTFIDFARPPRSERTRADLGAVVRRALALVEGRGRRQKVTLAADLPSAPVYLEIDPHQIHQVMVNLLLNALDALPRGGTVYVSVAPALRPAAGVNGPRAADPGVEVRVQDTGPGIAPRIRDRLFEPFVSSKETGLGLGLNICKRLIEAHGGTIRGDNAPDGGALFAFTLPAG